VRSEKYFISAQPAARFPTIPLLRAVRRRSYLIESVWKGLQVEVSNYSASKSGEKSKVIYLTPVNLKHSVAVSNYSASKSGEKSKA
jgi:hypothetical protein